MYDVEETEAFGQASRSGTRTGNPAADIEAVLNAVFGTAGEEKKTREEAAGGEFPVDHPGQG
jgi:hypothetical protein